MIEILSNLFVRNIVEILSNIQIPLNSININILTNTNFLELKTISFYDIFLSLISIIFGLFLLLLLLILKWTLLQVWVLRKIVHFLGGTYIAFIVFQFQNLSGILFTIGIFIIIFLILIIFSKGKLIQDYFMLDFRKDEHRYTFLLNTILTLIILFFSVLQLVDYPVAFTAGVLVITWGDTFGEIIGKTFPFVNFKIFNKKTITGSLAVFMFSSLSFIISLLYYGIQIQSIDFYKIIIGGLICMVVEALSWLWVDNLLLPPCGNLIMLWIVLT